MPKIALKAGAEVDILSKGELDESLSHYFAMQQVARLRGIKHLRLPETLYGKASSNAISLGVEKGNAAVGPESGFIWVFTRLLVWQMTTGASPDVVNFYRNSSASQPIWQLNGNNFGVTFGRPQVTLYPGETLAMASVGTFNSTNQIVVSGEVIEVPAELIGKVV